MAATACITFSVWLYFTPITDTLTYAKWGRGLDGVEAYPPKLEKTVVAVR